MENIGMGKAGATPHRLPSAFLIRTSVPPTSGGERSARTADWKIQPCQQNWEEV